MRELEAAKVEVVAERVRLLTEDQRDFRQQVRGEMKSVETRLTEKIDGQGRTLSWILRTMVGLSGSIIAAALIYALNQ